jgi:hypothetical protein
MTDEGLINSRRRFDRLSYSPLLLPTDEKTEPGDALGLATMVRSLELTSTELDRLQPLASTAAERAALVAIRALADAATGATSLAATRELATVSTATLRWFGEALADERARVGTQLRDGLKALDRQRVAQQAAPPALVAATPGSAETLGAATPASSGAAHGVGAAAAPASVSAPGAAAHGAAATRTATASDAMTPALAALGDKPTASHFAPARAAASLSIAAAVATFPVVPGVLPAIAAQVGPQLGARVDDVTAWGLAHATPQTTALIGVLRDHLPPTLAIDSLSSGFAQVLRRPLLVSIFLDALTRRTLQPLGLLHLERLEMTPLDVERGELVYSLPLAPKEKVTLAHREWTVREEQFSELIEDRLENFSETGVAESNDIALSTATQTHHGNTLDMGQPVSATATGITLTSPVTAGGGTSVVDDTASQDEAREHTRTVTSKASARTLQDHKTSFTVTTVAGMEDFTAHILENEHTDKVMLVDYFARVRNWRSDLYRYGVRLAYDVVLPDPGERLRTRWTELLDIDEQLRREFDFGIAPSAIGRASWQWLADSYGVALPAPPDATRVTETVHMIESQTPSITLTTDDGVKWTTHQRVVALSISVPDGSRLERMNVFANVRGWNNGILQWVTAIAGRSWMSADSDPSGFIHLDWDRGPFDVPTSGALVVAFRIQNALNGELKLTLTSAPTDATMATWRAQCYVLLREAALVRDGQHRAYLRDRAATLRRQIAAEDALHLRRLEREQIMRLVLSWLFPGFDDASAVIGGGTPGALDAARWQMIMEYGEYIKFVQNAIDWDHVTVFLYPYFWDNAWHAREKLFLEHPDAAHREFLRAGAARVIIAIQPGFEEQVVSLLDKGRLGALAPKSRFASVIADVQQANKDYAGTIQPKADPAALGGVLIGSWTDTTPTSGIDMDVTLSKVADA